MRTWDFHTPAAKLDLAMQTLQDAQHTAEDDWDDQAMRDFQQDYLEPLKPMVRKAIDAIHRLQTVLQKAERNIGSYRDGP